MHVAKVGVPTLSWRSVGHHAHGICGLNASSMSCCRRQWKDPIAGRLAMMGESPRQAGVLRAVAQLARWSGPCPINDRARGVAIVEALALMSHKSRRFQQATPTVRVCNKVWCAVDCGVSVNPDVIRAQMEGGIGSLVQWAWTLVLAARRLQARTRSSLRCWRRGRPPAHIVRDREGQDGRSVLESGPDNDIADVDMVGLLDRERHRAGYRIRLQRDLVHALLDLRLHPGIGYRCGEVGPDKSGEIPVTRYLPSASIRSPSLKVRTAFFVAA